MRNGLSLQSGRPQQRDQGVARRRGRLPHKRRAQFASGYAARGGGFAIRLRTRAAIP